MHPFAIDDDRRRRALQSDQRLRLRTVARLPALISRQRAERVLRLADGTVELQFDHLLGMAGHHLLERLLGHHARLAPAGRVHLGDVGQVGEGSLDRT